MSLVYAILFILGLVLILAGVAAIVLVLFRLVPTTALIDVATVPVDRSAKRKEEIIAERLIRKTSAKIEPVRSFFLNIVLYIRSQFRRLAHKAFELERHSERLARTQWDALTASTRMHALASEADELVKEDKFGEAEKKYIEALSIEQKNPKLYEKLGRLYLRVKQYDQARDTLRFASRLSPNDASVVAFLGEVALAREEYPDAVTYFQHAVSLRPRSPRYLDLLLESCIIAGNHALAKDALVQLASVNPENAKLNDFDRRIQAMN